MQRGGVCNCASWEGILQRLRAIVLDLDGTLYRQTPVRRGMLVELVLNACSRPLETYRVTRLLSAYRRAQEFLRADGTSRRQLAVACEWTQSDAVWATAVIDEWMHQRPLKLVAAAVYPGLKNFLQAARENSILLGLFSDYPAEHKLRALGLADYFDAIADATQPEINAFKPSPAGLLAVLARLGAEPENSVYIGDRPDVDAEAARRAGMQAWILTSERPVRNAGWNAFSGFDELTGMLGLTGEAKRRDE